MFYVIVATVPVIVGGLVWFVWGKELAPILKLWGNELVSTMKRAGGSLSDLIESHRKSADSPSGTENLPSVEAKKTRKVHKPHGTPIDVGPVDLQGPGDFEFKVVGSSHYQTNIERLAGGRAEDGVEVFIAAMLIPEKGNPHDPQAVRVEIKGLAVGYLDRETARAYRVGINKAGRKGQSLSVAAKIVGGWDHGMDDRGHFGVRLDMKGE